MGSYGSVWMAFPIPTLGMIVVWIQNGLRYTEFHCTPQSTALIDEVPCAHIFLCKHLRHIVSSHLWMANTVHCIWIGSTCAPKKNTYQSEGSLNYEIVRIPTDILVGNNTEIMRNYHKQCVIIYEVSENENFFLFFLYFLAHQLNPNQRGVHNSWSYVK